MIFGKKDDFSTLTFRKRSRVKIETNQIYDIILWVIGILVAVFLGVTLVYFYGLRINMVGSSMEPVLYNGQGVLLDRVTYRFTAPKRGDVIAFYPNGNSKSHLYIKRVIGLPGETIQIKDYYVYINGMRYFMDLSEYTYEAGVAENEIVLKEDEYFVLGDNRENSEDSRSANIGNVTRSMIIGKAWLHLKTSKAKMGLIE
ncbi:MAG: signal peptidase I [Lachnospiraceae bacterium]|nr:signal peptidase I [Lachnospiraceae bacterium]